MSDFIDADNKVELALLKHRVNNIDMKIDAIDKKLTDLLELRSKGMGAFWLMSILFGTSLVALVTMLINFMKGS